MFIFTSFLFEKLAGTLPFNKEGKKVDQVQAKP
jgi:hypothetical protein